VIDQSWTGWLPGKHRLTRQVLVGNHTQALVLGLLRLGILREQAECKLMMVGDLYPKCSKIRNGATVAWTSNAYEDPFGRLSSRTDSRIGTTVSHDAQGRVLSSTAPASQSGGPPLVTSTSYDDRAHNNGHLAQTGRPL